MSALPMISHRLFVTALRQDRVPARERREASAELRKTAAVPVCFQVLEAARPLPADGIRPLRVSDNGGRA